MIKTLFITNILCRHQVGIWDSLSRYNNIDFTYLCTRNPKVEVNIRYRCNEPREYTIDSYDINDDDLENIIEKADIIFYGSIEDARVKPLITNKKNAYIITEHFSKYDYHELYKFRGARARLHFKKNIINIISTINTKYVFCASSHTGEDFRLGGVPRSSTLKFGYFPIYHYANENIIKYKDKYSIIYVGRDETFKHPEIAYFFLKKLRKYDNYHLDVYGENLDTFFPHKEYINVNGSLLNDELIAKLLLTNIFVFPSDRREGWGVVLGEAMAAGRICFANVEAGSTSYLVKNGRNGFAYKSKNDLKKKIKTFIKLSDYKKDEIRRSAINTMKEEWSGTTAANRLYNFINSLYNNTEQAQYAEGPLSLDGINS